MDKNIIIDLNEKIVDFINEETDISKEELRKKITDIVSLVLKEENLNFENICISIDCVDKKKIQMLNKEYRDTDRATDVLSFPIFTKDELVEQNQLPDDKKTKEIELGDIILCLDVVKEHSIEYETGILREVLYMITHGVCHLVGHDHIEEDDKIKMRAVEEKVLAKIGVSKK